MDTFLEKAWYRLTNTKKYRDYKRSLSKKKNIENFKKHIEEYIINIQEKIKNNKELSFLHSGATGDLIYTLPVIKYLSKTHKCNLYVNPNKPLVKVSSDNFSQVLLTEHIFNMLMPLLKSQKYIQKAERYNNQEIDINLDVIRDLPINFQTDCLRYAFHVAGIQPDLSLPYLHAEPHESITNKIVIHRSFRYRNHFINYKFLENYKDIYFVGTKDEYEDLKSEVNNLQFHNCKDHLEISKIIKSSKVFIGNTSVGWAIAEGLKVPRLLEGCPYYPVSMPHGKDGYDSFFQVHFEKWFRTLYNL